jgi:peptidylprolyl isomerase
LRKLASVTVATGLLLSLAACAGGPFDPAACAPVFDSGGASELVSADGAFGKDPRVDFPTPLVSRAPQATLLSAGDGERVKAGDFIEFQVTVADGSDGAVMTASGYDADTAIGRIVGNDFFGDVAECSTVGSRVAATAPISEVFSEQIITSNGFKADDTVVVVIDVQSRYPGRASGADQLPPAGLPAVVLAPDGRPGLTIPGGSAPTDLRIAALKGGSGAVVETGDEVLVQYTGVVWETGAVFDSTWDRGAPIALTVQSIADAEDGVIPGFAEALVGQRVGSQVIAVIPPEFGYPEGTNPPAIPAGSTLIFVVDILGIK